MTQFLKGLGYADKEIYSLPISGLAGHNMKEKLDSKLAPWYTGDSLLGTLDNMPPIPRAKDAPLRIPILDKFKEMGGLNVMGKVEAGVIRLGQKLILQPGMSKVEVVGLANDMADLTIAEPGENIRVVLKGVDEEHVHRGFVLCDSSKPIPSTNEFVAQFRIMELPENKSLFTAGYQAVVHIHTAVEECTIVRLIAEIDPKSGEITKKLPNFVRSKAVVNAHVQLTQAVPCELFKDFAQLGRFTLRDEGKTVAFGKVLHIGPPKRKSDKK
jgi:peptide chain release factor subunit 3